MAVGGREQKGPKAPVGRQVVPAAPASLTSPIVVPNTFWTPTNPLAYDGGRPAEITHLHEYGETDAGRRDDGRWGGLDVVPTKADYILDLIRANSLWPLLSGLACCAFEMMSGATSKNDMDRWGMFPFRASPRQSDVLIVAARTSGGRDDRERGREQAEPSCSHVRLPRSVVQSRRARTVV